MPRDDAHARLSWRRPTLGGAAGIVIVAAGLGVGLRSLSDNSFLTHLATGRLILDSGSVPSTDPYTFTAPGADWVVQSWLVSVVFAAVERVSDLDGIRALTGVLAAVLAGLGWRLLRPADPVVARLAIAALFITVGAGQWAERPLMVGLVAFALVALATEGGLDPRWLLPLGWIWVNSHGSFPLAVVYLVVVAGGTRLDGGDWAIPMRCLGWSLAGIVAGIVGPLGPRVLLFPFELLGRQEVLQDVIEWRAPTFESLSQRAFLVLLGLAMVLLVRRPSYRSSLPVAVFAIAALLGARNVAVASIVILPAIAPAIAGLGGLSSQTRSTAARLLGVVAVALGGVVVTAQMREPSLRLDKYPVDALAYLEAERVDLSESRLAAPDYVGNLLEFVYGPRRLVFYDDRFDMFPNAVVEAHLALVNARPSLPSKLANHDISLVLTPRISGAAGRLVADPDWRTLYVDEGWMLSCRRNVTLGPSFGTC